MTADIYLSPCGIGDAVCGYYAACGLASTGVSVRFHTRHPDWFRAVSHEGVEILTHTPTGIDMGGGAEGYLRQHYEGTDRKLWYCKHIWEGLGIAPFEPTAPSTIDESPTGDYIMVFPYCHFGQQRERDWPALQYAWLAKMLARGGKRVIVCDNNQAEGHNRVAADLFSDPLGRIEWHSNWTPMQVLDGIRAAQCVIGNDSGMVHVAGLYGTPAVAIHSHFDAQLLWSHTDVRSIMPETSCSPCRFGNMRGSQFGKLCLNHGCAALGTVKAETVFSTVMEVLNDSVHQKQCVLVA